MVKWIYNLLKLILYWHHSSIRTINVHFSNKRNSKPTWTISFIWLVQTVSNSITQPISTDALAFTLTTILLYSTCHSLAHNWQFFFTWSQRPAIFTKVTHTFHINRRTLLVTYKSTETLINQVYSALIIMFYMDLISKS